MALFIGFSAVSCSKDTDPADVSVFLGTYKGSVEYACTNPVKLITETDAEVIVSKIGSTYSFSFNKGIPDITGVEFKKKDDNTLVSINDGFTDITITAKKLNLIVVRGGET